MCANATTIREILIAAEELGMVDSGEYVFFSIELTSRYSKMNWKNFNLKLALIESFN